ncbi:hypothetical protein PYW08_003163 [Mythimna loreyi]|uniref:Uncharacterized protein n=1 Tax=Mythimna loreyi TaxID=667449 RepID=A0ACC2QSM6_9NEOP|nr:hypothetical protein PYW08_003163 [Mythimna loreyi]
MDCLTKILNRLRAIQLNMTFDYQEILYFTGSGLSIVCVIVLLITWWLLPQWRSLQNYISMNQIITGTVFLCILTLMPFIKFMNKNYILVHYFFIVSICWSLCSSLLAYLRLVLVYVGNISCEKRTATIFTYGIALSTLGISHGIVLKLLSVNGPNDNFIGLFSVVFIMIINFILFVRIALSVLSCCKKSMSRRNFSHIVSLIAVAFICDSILIALVALLIFSTYQEPYLQIPTMFFFTHRLVFRTLFILFKRTNRMHWELYFKKRNNRNVNLII